MQTRRFARFGFSASALLLGAGVAHGQTALGDGRALERNPQVGFGGYNAQAPSISDQIRLNNAIITGNATDGRSFRGYVGYGSPSDFRATVGSDTLYSFRRDAAISGAFGAGVRGTDALRYQFALSTGQSLPLSIAQTYGALQRSGAATSASSSTALRSTSEYLASQSVRPTIVGGRIDTDGYEWAVKTSPLLGVSWTRSDRPIMRVERPDDTLSKYDLGAMPKPTDDPLASRGRLPGLSGLEAAAPGVDSVLDREAHSPLRVPSTQVKAHSTDVHAQLMQNLNTAFNGAPVTESNLSSSTQPSVDVSLEAQLDRLRSRLRGEPEKPRPSQPSIYEPIINRLNSPDRKPGDSPAILNEPARPSSQATDPAATPDPVPGLPVTNTADSFDPRKPSGPGDFRQVPKNTDPEIDPATGKRRPRGLDPSTNPLTPEMIKGIKSVGSRRIDMLTRPRVALPGESRPDQIAYEQHMAAGQELLTSGKYFDAEDRFIRALAASPGDPLAQVGRAHAELGAGLYVSAAANLRSLFANHPEMIGATYGSNLVPTGERADKIAEQLRLDMSREVPSLGRDAAMLLAYLGHIRSDAIITREGLAEMAKRYDANEPSQATFLDLTRAAWGQ